MLDEMQVHLERQTDLFVARGMKRADVRFALRSFVRKPLPSATIVLVLAIGIAGYGAVFGRLRSE